MPGFRRRNRNFDSCLLHLHRLQHPLDGFAAGHAGVDAEGLGLGRATDDFRVEQVFGLGERIGGRPAGDRDGLAEFGGYIEGINTAANDACGGLDRAALSVDPALAHADGRAAGKLHFALRDKRKFRVHGSCSYIVRPPSTTSAWPVIMPASQAKKMTTSAMSSVV